MSQSTTSFNYVYCDGPNCKKAVNIEVSNPEATAKALEANPWLKSPRGVTAGSHTVMTPQGPQVVPNQFLFCSDICLVDAATAGMFISEAEKLIIAPAGNGEAAVRQEAARQAAINAADKALRNGEGARIQVAVK